MSTKKEIYLAIKEQILAKTSIKHVRLFNSQFTNMEQESAFPFPCVFVQFLTLPWSTEVDGIQKADANIRLHVGFRSVNDEVLEMFDVIDDQIHRHIEGFEGNCFGKMNRVNEEQDIEHDNVYVWLMDYATNVVDTSGSRRGKMTKTTLDKVAVTFCTDSEITKPRLARK